MDPNAVVLEISSDEEGGWNNNTNNHVDRGVIGGSDDYNWIADILDQVNRDDCGYDDDSDDVVLVGEVLAKKPRRKLAPKSASFIDFDDDCVVLDHDPDKPPPARKDDPSDRDEEDDDEDDIVVVSEKGQVACRDYPHPRHLCIKFPFSSTPNQSHCDQCYCYVCDSLAPCIYWGNGSGGIDHCLATDKSDFWKVERQNSKNVGKDVGVAPLKPVPQTPSIDHSQALVSNPIRACPVTSNFVVPNIANQDRSSFWSSRNKYQPDLVSQQLTRASSCTIPGSRVHHSYNQANPVHRPVFKRTASDMIAPTSNRYTYSPYYRGNYRNHFTPSSQPNIVNTSVPFSPRSNSAFDFPSHFQPNVDPCVEAPVLFQPNPVPLSYQAQGNSSLPQYAVPPEASRQESQRSTADPKFFQGINWPQSQINQQPGSQSSIPEGVGLTDQPSLASGSGGVVDYEYDNWMFNNQPREAGSMDGSGPFGLSEFSPDPGFIDSGTIFDF